MNIEHVEPKIEKAAGKERYYLLLEKEHEGWRPYPWDGMSTDIDIVQKAIGEAHRRDKEFDRERKFNVPKREFMIISFDLPA
jgi:hypothetical protein